MMIGNRFLKKPSMLLILCDVIVALETNNNMAANVGEKIGHESEVSVAQEKLDFGFSFQQSFQSFLL